MLLAGILGAITGLLLAPKSGRETRKELEAWVKKLKTDLKKGKKTGEKIVDEVVQRVAKLKETGQGIDKNKYGQLVDEIVADFKAKGKIKKQNIDKLKTRLKRDWRLVSRALRDGIKVKSEAGK